MSTPNPLHNKQQRKKARRKARKNSERQAHRNLDDVTSEAIAQAQALAPEVANGAGRRSVSLALHLASMSEAQFVRKRVNDALKVDEWLDEIRVVLAGPSAKAPDAPLELRLERAPHSREAL